MEPIIDHIVITSNSAKITKESMLRFFAAKIMMQLHISPNLSTIWCKDNIKNKFVGNRLVQQTISRNEFCFIRNNMNFNFNWIQTKLNELFQHYWIPYPDIVIDDTLYDFFGRSAHKVKRPRKPDCWGKCLKFQIFFIVFPMNESNF